MKRGSSIKHANKKKVKISPEVEVLIFVDEVLSESISEATYDAICEHSGGKGVFLKEFLIG
jgi:hypothetical protein